jgi:hypothetical protein
MLAGRKRIELESGEPDPANFFDGMTGLEKALAQEIAARVSESNVVPRGILAAAARDARAGGAREGFDLGEGEKSFQFELISLREAIGGHHAIGKVAVVGEQQETARMVFEAADRKDAFANAVEEIAEAAAAFGVAHGGDDFGGLVEHDVDQLGRRLDELAGNFDVVARGVGLGAQLGDEAAVDGDEAGRDHLLGVSSRGEAGASDDFLQAFFHA